MIVPIWLYGDKLAVATSLKKTGFFYYGEVNEEISYDDFFEETEPGGDFFDLACIDGYFVGDILENFELNVIFPSGEIFTKKIPVIWDDDEGCLPIDENWEIIENFSFDPLIKETIALIKTTLWDWHHKGQLSLFTA
jgi:hypothetical protein